MMESARALMWAQFWIQARRQVGEGEDLGLARTLVTRRLGATLYSTRAKKANSRIRREFQHWDPTFCPGTPRPIMAFSMPRIDV